MSLKSRKLKFSYAINEAIHLMMGEDKSIFLIGQGVKSPWYVGHTADGLLEKFGPERVIDTPVSENSVTGAAVGAALVGMRPIVVHPRMDFMLYAFDPIINEAANWRYMSGGASSVPVVIWGIINRGAEQAAQHSQAFHALFSHIPGLKVVMPSTPYDAKGLLISSIKDDNPVIFIDDRWLHGLEEEVPEGIYEVPIGKAVYRKEGNDISLISVSYMAYESQKAAIELDKIGINAEVLDLRTVKPLDEEMILQTISKTGRAVIIDGGWKNNGLSAEVAAIIAENGMHYLKEPVKRITLPACPAPASKPLEDAYYPKSIDIVNKVKSIFK